MAYSRQDLAIRALRKANLIGSEETPSAADLAYIQETISSDTAALVSDGIVIINGSDMMIPLNQLEPLARYYAISAQQDYGMLSADQAARARQVEKLTLRRICAKPATGAPQPVEFY